MFYLTYFYNNSSIIVESQEKTMIRVKKHTSDIKDLLNEGLDLEMWEEVQDCIRDDYSEDDAVFFAYDQDRIIGYIFGSLLTGDCWRIAVDYRYRNQGIAKKLISESGFKKPYDVLDTEDARSFWNKMTV